jgi:uncharacterized membrane protein YfcA
MNECFIALLLVTIVFFAAFEQTITGFGFSLIVMPLVSLVLGIRTAAPVVALTALTLYVVNLIRHREAVRVSQVVRLSLALACGIPVGIWALSNVIESAIKMLLGALLIGFAYYSLAQRVSARLISKRWSYLAGFLAGCLGGAYNTPGPPLIVYGTLQRWEKDEFRAALQFLFFVTGVLTVLSHVLTGHLTMPVLTIYAYVLPALLLGIIAGAGADRWIDKRRFRALVNVMILILGLSLVVGVGR